MCSSDPLKIILSILLLFLPTSALAEDTYKFQRMWPTLQQPWYFSQPTGVSVDSAGHVYVLEESGHRVQKFTSDGHFVSHFGGYGSGDGQFNLPTGMGVDSFGFVYVTEFVNNHRIQKFSPDGEFLRKWGRYGISTIPAFLRFCWFSKIEHCSLLHDRKNKVNGLITLDDLHGLI